MCRTCKEVREARRGSQRARDRESDQGTVLPPFLTSPALLPRYPAELGSWKCCALFLRQCHITGQNVQHLYIVRLCTGVGGEVRGVRVKEGWWGKGGCSIARWLPLRWPDPQYLLCSGSYAAPTEPGWVSDPDQPCLKKRGRETGRRERRGKGTDRGIGEKRG